MENAILQYKAALSKANVKINRIGSSNALKTRFFHYFIFVKVPLMQI